MMAFIDQNKDDVVDGRRLGVEPICAVLQVALSSYYAARDRPPSERARRDAQLMPRLTEIWKTTMRSTGRGSYGRPRGVPGSISAATRPLG
jgi:hypothetical protein